MKKIMIFAVTAAALSATPASAAATFGDLHSYSSKPLTKVVGLCRVLPWFPRAWQPCWRV